MVILLIVFIVVITTLGVLSEISGNKLLKREKQNFENKISSVPDFTPTQTVRSLIDRYYFAADDVHRKIMYFNPTSDTLNIVKYEDIIDVKIIENNVPTSQKKSMKRTVGGAIIGGAVAGEAGAVIGGLSGDSMTESAVTIKVKILVRNQSYPSIVITFFEGVTDNTLGLDIYSADAHKIYDICSVILDKIKNENSDQLQSQPILDQKTSIADELEKFARLRDQGIITEQEFLGQKTKLLSK